MGDNQDGENEKAIVSPNLGSLELHGKDGSDSCKVPPHSDLSKDDSVENYKDDFGKRESTINANNASFIASLENDINVWLPPDPEEIEDDVDGIERVRPSHSNTLNEERNKAMVEAMNGPFMFLVSRFLASEGISCSKEETGESWLNIVASLSWKAAHLVKPDANVGKEMDPASYIKVKRIACGSRSESGVVNGLVFKKNTAHKHMPTKFKNPRLVLLKGVLGENDSKLSSFDKMTEEKGHLKSVIDMIEKCLPDVVLVEKNVSRDVQEILLEKGITLVFDMKLPRLQRIARCTGSPIVSLSDITMNTELKQCKHFNIEKFLEEHNQPIGAGKKTSKTLMFFDGLPKPLGCTILLKGAPSEELKNVKRVMQYTIFAAYHLILETSFFEDQRAISLDTHNIKEQSSNSLDPDSDKDMEKPDAEGVKQNSDMVMEGYFTDISSNGNVSTLENLYDDGIIRSGVDPQEKEYSSFLLNPGSLIQFVSTSIRKSLGERFPLQTGSFEAVSSYFRYDENKQDSYHENDQVIQDIDLDNESIPLKNIDVENFDNGKIEPVSDLMFSLENVDNVGNVVDTPQKRDIDAVLDPQSILLLFSKRSILKNTACEERYLTRIKYYGNFDTTLGRFLQDTLQTHSCDVCGESHNYCYTHQNGKLSINVNLLPKSSWLSGVEEEQIWMWTRCLKCDYESGVPKPTKRVVMSGKASDLSFGKFLELSFSSHAEAKKRLLSKCGHLLHRDCLRFFGLGSKVAMFTYSPVEIYAACKPTPLLDLTSLTGQDWFENEANDVRQNEERFFSEVESLLQKMQPKLSIQLVKLPRSKRVFSKVEEILRQDKAEFEMSTTIHVPKNFNLTCLNQELLLLLYVWDCRFRSLMSQASANSATLGSIKEKQFPEKSISLDGTDERIITQKEEKNGDNLIINNEESDGNFCDEQEINVVEPSTDRSGDSRECPDEKVDGMSDGNGKIVSSIHEGTITARESSVMPSSYFDVKPSGVSPIQVDIDHSNMEISATNCSAEMPVDSMESEEGSGFDGSINIVTENPEDWIWRSFQEIRKDFWKDYSNGHLNKFESIISHSPKFLSPLNQVVAQERERLCYPIGTDGFVISIHDEEISSIIACAEIVFQERYLTPGEKEVGEYKLYTDNETEDMCSLSSSDGSVSSFSPSSSEWTQSSQSTSSVPSDKQTSNMHPEIPLGAEKDKNRYSVVCIYAKQFYDLRRQCCSSEIGYISSLGRCKKWDPQGGKSKVLFAKTLDDRFIIKEINKTELASFLKFAPEYFVHVLGSLRSGSQTCLAKIMGIYQVKRLRGGKEVQHDLVVIENLLFGRNISRTYDLKGAMFSRYISDPNNPGAVLLDQNFVEDMGLSPMYVGGRTKQLLQRAIWNDTSFLTSINVMDYSLLVGVDMERRQLVFGIIDYLRQYTWDKQLETWVKASLVVPKNSLPTVISPKEYKKRFRKFMSKYLLTVPDSWIPERRERCSEYCRLYADISGSCKQSCAYCSQENSSTPK